MARKRTLVSVALAITVVAAASVSPGVASAQSGGSAKKTLHIIGAYERPG